MYRVFENGVRCKDLQISGWEKDTFDTKEEAFIFMFHWAWPINNQIAKDTYYNETNKLNHLTLEVGKEYDLSTNNFPIMMKVEKVLLECPFCGFEPNFNNADCCYPADRWKTVFSLNCYESGGGCGANILGDNPEDCFTKWNTRKGK